MTMLMGLCLLSVILVYGIGGAYGNLFSENLALNHPVVLVAFKGIKDYYAARGDHTARTLVRVLYAHSQLAAGRIYSLMLAITVGNKHQACEVKVMLKSLKDISVYGVPNCRD